MTPGSYTVALWHEGTKIVDRELESGKVKKYHFEEPYEMKKNVVVPPDGSVVVNFDLTLR